MSVLLCFGSASACDQDVERRIQSTTIKDGEITRRELVLHVPATRLKSAPSWVAGSGPMPLSPEAAVKSLREWLREHHPALVETKLMNISIEKCNSRDPAFKLYIFNVPEIGNVAMLFDGTVFPGKVTAKET